MQTGLDVLLSNDTLLTKLSKSRTAVLAHAASVTQTGEHIIFALRRNHIDPVKIFAPEHGLWGAAQDMEGVDHGFDSIVERNIISLYGHSLDSLSPDDALLDDLDTVIIDIQDVGARYYTFGREFQGSSYSRRACHEEEEVTAAHARDAQSSLW